MLFIEYQALVIKDYEAKKRAGTLRWALSPARVRTECVNAFNKRYNLKDERTLNDFFGDRKDNIAYISTIKNFDRDKFRPLINFLKKSSNYTDEKNIELLAWLIDYEPRPHDFNRKAIPDPSEIGEPGIPVTVEEMTNGESAPTVQKIALSEAAEQLTHPEPIKPITVNPLEDDNTKMPWPKKKITIASLSAALIISASVYFGRMNISSQPPSSGPQSCMYWNGDHYEATPCNETEGKNLVIALDSLKLRNFRKITQQDTITFRSKGSVWYVKINGGIEYYTSDGFHPVDIRLRLKPITDYMIRKYIYNAQALR